MKLKALVAISLTATTLLAACQPQQGGSTQMNKQTLGGLAGAIAGGAAGSRFGGGEGKIAATIAGTLLGGYLGSEVGASLDRADMAYYNQTSQRALESAQPGQSLPWSNPESGNSGTVTPSAYYQTAGGQYCREYSQTINVGGRAEQGHGTACRQPDGTWKIVN